MTSIFPRLSKLTCVAVALASAIGTTPALAANGRAIPIDQRMRGAQKVVVARARNVAASWRENAHGDRIIVSRVMLDVEETLKGAAGQVEFLDLEGGTIDGVTLHVSDLPTIAPGERAVFFLEQNEAVQSPHLRGQGILKLDETNLVRGSSLRLDEVRRIARAVR